MSEMSALELQQLVEKIVQRVMQRIEDDAELSRLIKSDEQKASVKATAAGKVAAGTTSSAADKRLYTESDILALAKQGVGELVVAGKTIITPAARDAAKLKGIEIRKE